MTSLQTAEKSRKTPSHEARLGILVITILVFAFGFLVYHKMDLHQRKLTEAAINPVPASESENPAETPFAEFASNGGVTETTNGDPLVKAADLSDGSPFSDSVVGELGSETSTTKGSPTSGQTFVALNTPNPEPAFSEPQPASAEPEPGTQENSNTEVPDFQFSEPTETQSAALTEPAPEPAMVQDAANEAFPEPVIEFPGESVATRTNAGTSAAEPLPQSSGNDPGPGFDPQAAQDSNPPMLQAETESNPFGAEPVTAVSNDAKTSDAETSVAAQEANPFGNEPTVSSDEEQTAQKSSNSEMTPSMLVEQQSAEPVMVLDAAGSENGQSATSSEPVPRPLDAAKNTFGELAATEAAATVTNDSPQIAPATDEAFASAPNQARTTDEPVMIAMAEPQEGNPFSGGFTPDEETRPTQKAPATEPSFEQPAFSQSRGFDAVTNPSGKARNTAVRNAAGSGADGKFSLAAFNYQNEAIEAAPDDGSTYDSIVVQSGDNYSKISKRVYGTVRYFSALAVFNQHRISDPKKMRPGMIVLTPEASVLEERYPQLFIDSKPKVAEPAGFLVMDDGSPAYRVGERETLSQISERFLGRSARWVEIYRLNQSVVTDPNKLKAGIILALPDDATEVNITP